MRTPLRTRLDKLEQVVPKGETVDFIHRIAVQPGTMMQTFMGCWVLPHAKAKGLRCERCAEVRRDDGFCPYDKNPEATGQMTARTLQ